MSRGGARRIVLPGAALVAAPTALRPWRDSDAEALVVLCNDPEIARWTRVPENYRMSDARAFMQMRHDHVQAGVSAPFAIVQDSAEGRLVGSISLMRFAWSDRRAEVGYWVGAPARGQGHATRATRLICRWGMRALGLERITLLAATGNRASQRVAEATGFTREATLRDYAQAHHERQDMACFGLLAGDRAAG